MDSRFDLKQGVVLADRFVIERPVGRGGTSIIYKATDKVLERTVVDGKVGESEVEQHELATDVKDGTARQTLRLEKGAQYIVRAEGIDPYPPVTLWATRTRIADVLAARRNEIDVRIQALQLAADTARIWAQMRGKVRSASPVMT